MGWGGEVASRGQAGVETPGPTMAQLLHWCAGLRGR